MTSATTFSHWDFGNSLITIGDLDPIYIALNQLSLEDEPLARWLVSYWCFYHAGVSCYLSSSDDFWGEMEGFAGDKEIPRGTERRHFRGKKAVDAVKHLRGLYSTAVEAINDLVGDLQDRPTFQRISKKAQEWPMFGPWIAFKVADMLERCAGVPVDFSDCNLELYEEPIAGAMLIAEEEGWPKDLGLVVDRLLHHYSDKLAPPDNDRPINIQEVETILCKFKSHRGGHYPVGKDTKEIGEGLADPRWGDTAKLMGAYLPGLTQKRFSREKAVMKEGTTEYIPLSMRLGGKLEVTPVETGGIKRITRKTAPAPRGWYKGKHEPKNRRPRPCYTEAVLTTPYSGYCNVGCKFCYVNMGTRGYKSTMLPTVNEDYPDQMEKQLAKMMTTAAAYMSSYTETFQELEDTYHITERLSRVFNKHGVPIFYLSRKIPPEWVEETLTANPYSYMQWSVNTSNPKTLRRISPGIFKLDDLLKHIERFSSLGIYTSFQVNPILPGVTSKAEWLELIRMLAGAGADHLIFKFVEESYPQKKVMLAKLRESKVDGIDELDRLLCDTFGHQYYIQQDLRIEWLTEALELTRSLGITMSTCYEYYNNGASGASMAPWFTTSDQCHGPSVPMHYRPAPGEKFVPLPGCYRKGCLYCEQFGTKSCQNDKLLSASQLQYKDYREIDLSVIPADVREKDWDMVDSAPKPGEPRGRNPEVDGVLQTDSQLWGLPPILDVVKEPSIAEEKLGCGAGCTCSDEEREEHGAPSGFLRAGDVIDIEELPEAKVFT